MMNMTQIIFYTAILSGVHGDLYPRPDDHLVVPRPLHQQRLHHGQRHRSRVRAATAANFVTTSVIIMAKYSIFHHQSLDCLGLDGPRWSRFHSFLKVINLNVGWFLNPAQFARRLLLTKRSGLFSNITRA